MQFQIIITPPTELQLQQHDPTTTQTTPHRQDEEATIAELRALGVNARVIQMAQNSSHSNRHSQPTFHGTSRPNIPPTPAPFVSPIDEFERMRIDSSGEIPVEPSSQHERSTTRNLSIRPNRPPTTWSNEEDEIMHDENEMNENQAIPTITISAPSDDTSPTIPSHTLSTQQRIPSAFFKSTFTDRDGYLLPPISNPDLTPSLARADSFWCGEEAERTKLGERTIEDHWVKRQQQRILAEQTTESFPIQSSKTKSIYASALQPRSNVQSHLDNDELIDEDDWSSVLDATVLVAHHELNRASNPHHPPPTSSNTGTSISLAHDDLVTLKRKHHPHHHHAKNKHMRVLADGVDTSSTHTSPSSTYTNSCYSSTSNSPSQGPISYLLQPSLPNTFQSSSSFFSSNQSSPEPPPTSYTSGSESEEDDDQEGRHITILKSSPINHHLFEQHQPTQLQQQTSADTVMDDASMQ